MTKTNHFKILEERPKNVKFKLDDVFVSYMNGIRRTLLNSIKVVSSTPNGELAPSFVDHNQGVNTCVFHGEFIAHRISNLVYDLPRISTELRRYEFKIHGNTEDEPYENKENVGKYLMSEDINVYKDHKLLPKKDTPIIPGVQIMYLQPGHKLKTSYKVYLNSVNQNKTGKGNGIYQACQIEYDLNDDEKSVIMNVNLNHFKFNYITAVDIVLEAILEIKNRLTSIIEYVNMQDDDHIQIIKNDTVNNLIDVYLFNIDSYTLGSIITDEIMELDEDYFVSYKDVHPLENTLHFRIKGFENKNDALDIFMKGINNAINKIKLLEKEWKSLFSNKNWKLAIV